MRVVVLLVPDKFRVVGPSTELNARTLGELDARGSTDVVGDGDGLAAALRRLCAAQHVIFVDATAALREKTRAGELVYLPLDTHLSAAGHAVLADLVTAALRAPPDGDR